MIRFKSQATADLLMFNEHGIKVLELWGKAVTPQGILLRSDMPAALTAIEAFLAQASASANQANGAPLADDEADEAGKTGHVTWRARLAPLVKTLQQCMAEDADLTWQIR